ncbi:MAG: DNA-directed RNA polymerase [Candidatus Lokiarchaeota archaeon]|nr:DNA-directed RNA polymerase [Candidatus Lokiarchaeota archaeon]
MLEQRYFKVSSIKLKFGENMSRNYGDRTMHKATCADCGNECEVPFKPKEDRPVYCRDCYRKHRK